MTRKKTIPLLVGLAVLAAFCYGGWVLTGWLSVVCWVGAFFALGATIMAGESKPCPACGQQTHAAKGRVERCLKCGEYVAHARGGYVHVHGAVLPEEFRFPEGCCVCGAAATRAFAVTAEKSAVLKNLGKSAAGLAAGVASVHTGGGTTYSVDVPHCDEHEEGAFLRLGTLTTPALMFRSESYRDAFCELNGAEKKRAPGRAEPVAEPVGV